MKQKLMNQNEEEKSYYDDMKVPCRGEMLRNTTVGGYRLGADGAYIEK